ncbi:helix-turn-helix transcriptional regulator [Lacinutrix sp. Hel_I_90]|uniref:helix-turn-helix transcriptional regulator n=1 Tax=Lacinutrix sp. Hel_I_90 TaxID=1249999 RepID=UPI0005CA3AFC|nr:helix-turn-helix transcriptional regulator [Lacinutrix sp. Hel_I_90]
MIKPKIATKQLFHLIILSFIISFTTLSFRGGNSVVQDPKNTLVDSIKKYLYNEPEKAIPLIKKLIKQSKKNEYVLMGYGALAVAHNIKGDIDSTLFYYNKGLFHCKSPADIFRFKYDIGKVYEKQHNYKYALLCYQECNDILEKEGLPEQKDFIKHSLAIMENKIGQPEKALKILREIYTLEKKKGKNVKKLRYTRKYLAEIYLNTKKPDSALILIDEGMRDAKSENNRELQYYFFKLKAECLLYQKQHKKALIEIDSALKIAKNLNNLKFKNQANYLLSLTQGNLGDYLNSITIVKSILSTNSEKTEEELSKYYKLLATNYEAIDSSTLSVIYYKKFTIEKQKLTDKRLATLDNIYSIDVKEQIDKKDHHKNKSQFWLFLSLVLCFISLTLIITSKTRKRKSQKHFDYLMVKIKNHENNEALIKNSIITIKSTSEQFKANDKTSNDSVMENEEFLKTSAKTAYIIDNEQAEKILIKVKEFEDKKYYLNQDCTMHNMAKRLKTNTSYLSQVINKHLDKTFSAYINELRINYVILELKNNKRLRSYSVQAISQEIGYKSTYSFSKYFKEATGLTPSVYIKKISSIS